jgi:polysaccharide export outer membrane protein
MSGKIRSPRQAGSAVAVLFCTLLNGCLGHHQAVPSLEIPKELNKVTHPPYRIEPPDILQIDLIAAVPKAPYKLQTLDAIAVRVMNTPPDAPVEGVFSIDPEGTVFLGSRYGAPQVAGLTVHDARAVIQEHLKKSLKDPVVEVSLAQTRGVQQVRGPHLVRQDGMIWLGNYGGVHVTGLTIPEARAAIENQLRGSFQDPQVSVDIVGYNSKVYYVIFDGGGAGQQVIRLPVTGNETVLDAIGQVTGLTPVADTQRIWVSRPAAEGCSGQVLPVNWKAITEEGQTGTNYQLLPGDRVFVKALPMVTFDTKLARTLSPFERLFGFSLLGASTIEALKFKNNNNNNNNP